MHANGRQTATRARYPNLASARRAIDALQNRGIEAGDIQLVGPAARHASDHIAGQARTAEPDRDITLRLTLRAVLWGGVGAVIGAIVGVIIASTVGVGPLGTNYGAQVITYGIGGLIVGALVAAMTAISQGEAWELTFEPGPEQDEPVEIVVHDTNPAVVERAAHILRHKDAERVEIERS